MLDLLQVFEPFLNNYNDLLRSIDQNNNILIRTNHISFIQQIFTDYLQKIQSLMNNEQEHNTFYSSCIQTFNEFKGYFKDFSNNDINSNENYKSNIYGRINCNELSQDTIKLIQTNFNYVINNIKDPQNELSYNLLLLISFAQYYFNNMVEQHNHNLQEINKIVNIPTNYNQEIFISLITNLSMEQKASLFNLF